MGALEDLAAMLAQGQAAASAPDVGKLIAQENPYLKLQQAPDFISQNLVKLAQDPNGTYKTRDLMIGGLLSGLLSGGLGTIGADYSNTLADRYQNVLQQAALGQTPEDTGDLSPALFGAAKNQGQSVFSKNLLDKIKRGQDIQDAGLKKQAETIGGIQGENAAYGVTGGTNPNSPLSKEADAARQEIDKLPVVQKLKTTNTSIAQMAPFASIDTASSDIPFATLFIGGLDGSVVREGEYNRVAGSNPLLAKFQNLLEGALNGTSKLGVDIKQQMLNELKTSQQTLLDEANKQALPRLTTALSRGVKNPLDVLPYDPNMKFDIQQKQAAPIVTSTGGLSPQQKIIAEAKAKFGDTPEGKAAALAAINELTIPTRGAVPLG